MPTERWLTDDEKDEIRQVVKDQKLFGYTNDEATQICSERLSKKFGLRETLSKKSYEVIKLSEADRDELTNWITVYSTTEYLAKYKEWMDGCMWRAQKQNRILEKLTSEPMEEQKKNVFKIIKLTRSLREETMLEASLGLGTPILRQMKNAIDKGLADEFLPIGQLKRDKELRKVDKRDISRGKFAA